MKTLIALTFTVLLSQNILAHALEEKSCHEALKGPSGAGLSEKSLQSQNSPTTGDALAALDRGLKLAEALGSADLGTKWLERRYDKRREDLLKAFGSGSFRKLVAAKPEIARNIYLWEQALARMAKIDQTFGSLTDTEKKAFQTIYDAVRAALTSHALSWSKVSTRELDFPRIQYILKEIANFNPEKPKYSLYRIKRIIETRHSLREYAECR